MVQWAKPSLSRRLYRVEFSGILSILKLLYFCINCCPKWWYSTAGWRQNLPDGGEGVGGVNYKTRRQQPEARTKVASCPKDRERKIFSERGAQKFLCSFWRKFEKFAGVFGNLKNLEFKLKKVVGIYPWNVGFLLKNVPSREQNHGANVRHRALHAYRTHQGSQS